MLPIPEKFAGGCVIDYRWELYRDYLRRHVEDYSMVFTADVRDAFFQADVFKHYEGKDAFLGIALEDGDLTQPCNKNWLINRYGEKVWKSVKDNRIICTGTVWATSKEFLAFASEMVKQINSDKYPYFRVCDQAVGNYLIYYDNMFPDLLRPSTNYDGCVMTIALTDAKDIHIDSQGFILNGKGEIAAVVHQYDRKLELVKMIHKKYGQGMTIFGKLAKTCANNTVRRIARFIVNIRKKGFLRVAVEAIQRRIHH